MYIFIRTREEFMKSFFLLKRKMNSNNKKFKLSNQRGEGFSLFLRLGENNLSFDLEKAICNHGFFMMAPNSWISSSKTLKRPLRLADSSKSVEVSILKPCASIHKNCLVLRVHDVKPNDISRKDENAIKQQVCRMLRISRKDEENVKEYQEKLTWLKDKDTDNDNHIKTNFDRMFRSPSLFEDLVKCLLLCNNKWSNSLKMARALCELQFEPHNNASMRSDSKKRRREECFDGKKILGDFPSSRELATLNLKTFQELTEDVLGYRAKSILRLAKDVESGKIRLDEFEGIEDRDILLDKFMQIKGFGPFASASALMCVGYYHKVPADTETIRHLQQVHGRKICNKGTVEKDVEEIYNKYSPFQCLAYWSELLNWYESKFGKLSQLSKSDYNRISGSDVV